MQAPKPVGRGAAARKYDLLTALGARALSQGKSEQRLVLRLITLITARYNWARDELAVGQREIARLWSCDPRTVKREMARLRALGWLTVRRQGARGRVTEYGLAIDTILSDTRPQWPAVGPDFELRLQPAPDRSVIPFPASTNPVAAPTLRDGTEWSLAASLLHREDPGLYAAWLRALRRTERAGGRLTLTAPSRFHAAYVETHLKSRLLAACRAVDDSVSEIVLIV